jgi:peptidylprolyl isomerase
MLKYKFYALLTGSLVLFNPIGAEEAPSLSQAQKVSQAFGHLIGKNLETQGFSFDTDHVIEGIRAAVSGKDSPMTQEEYQKAMTDIQENSFKVLAAANLTSANEFLSKNAGKDSVVEIESGKLQIEIINEGNGESVAEHATPMIHYKGTYSDGTVFGSSEDGGGPVTLPLDQTIPGFGRGIVGMKEGEKRRIYIHPELGYGTGGHLAPNSLLIFDVEVLSTETSTEQENSIAEGDSTFDSQANIADATNEQEEASAAVAINLSEDSSSLEENSSSVESSVAEIGNNSTDADVAELTESTIEEVR